METNDLFGPPRLIHRQTHHDDVLKTTQETSFWQDSVEKDCYYLEQVTVEQTTETHRIYFSRATLLSLLPHLASELGET